MVTEDDTLLTLLPLFHGFGMVVISFFALCGGSKVVTVPNFEPKFFLQTLEQEKVYIYFDSKARSKYTSKFG